MFSILITFVNGRNVCVFYFCIFSDKLDLSEATCLIIKGLNTCCSFVGGLSIGSVIVSLQSESGSRLDSPHLESAVDEKLDSCSIFIRTFFSDFRTKLKRLINSEKL